METSIGKWGNSLALRIPHEMAEELGLKVGAKVTLSRRKKQLVIEPEDYSLKSLLKGISPDHRHDGVAWGLPAGREVW
ncbi:MAG: AbrB/MazE/SpoVT family DNA-binding domain-containing protein [Alphaproteobacteria bacterium]|nr:AbrB/MazE/SpoVT family DNA-binding domain-containing protein [Alphaproteobacteria bacterium]NDC57190.1 AbrB/MazE/SpoVT family DNA-binding domain-containing protein [Alphaproteobacteria bacterium]